MRNSTCASSPACCSPDGVAVTTWFLFDKANFPMMQEFQNALYISDFDPTNAVIFDRTWLSGALARRRARSGVGDRADRPRPSVGDTASESMIIDLPVPPPEYRRLVGQPDASQYGPGIHQPAFDYVPDRAYRRILDFGCGCGRLARGLIQDRDGRPIAISGSTATRE